MSDLITRRDFIARSGVALSALAMPFEFGTADRHYLYVAEPGIRNYVEWGGIGILVYDMSDNFRFVRRIPTMQVAEGEAPENVKGICARPAPPPTAST